MATLRTAELSLLRLGVFQYIRGGIQAVMHNITTLLAMARRQPARTRVTGLPIPYNASHRVGRLSRALRARILPLPNKLRELLRRSSQKLNCSLVAKMCLHKYC